MHDGKTAIEQQEEEIECLQEKLRKMQRRYEEAMLEDLHSKIDTFLLGVTVEEIGAVDRAREDISELMRRANKLGREGVSVLYNFRTGKREGEWHKGVKRVEKTISK